MKHASSVLPCPFFCQISSFSVLAILRTRSRQFFVWYLNCGLPLPTFVLSCLVTGCDPTPSAYFLSTSGCAPVPLILERSLAAAYLQPFLSSAASCWLFDSLALIFYDGQIVVPLLLICNEVSPVKHAIASRLNSSMSEFRFAIIGVNGGSFLDFILYTVTQRPLVWFQFYEEVSVFLPDFVNDIFLHGHGICCDDFPDISIFSISSGTTFISLLFSSQTSVASVMSVLNEWADTISGVRPFFKTVPRSAFPSMQMISWAQHIPNNSLWNASAKTCSWLAIAWSSIPSSIRQRVASDGMPLANISNLRKLLRLCLPNSMISALLTQFDIRPNISNMMTSLNLWRMFPFSVLRKSGIEEENV